MMQTQKNVMKETFPSRWLAKTGKTQEISSQYLLQPRSPVRRCMHDGARRIRGRPSNALYCSTVPLTIQVD